MSSEKKMTADMNKINDGTAFEGNFGIKNNRGTKVCPHCKSVHSLTAPNKCRVCGKEILTAEERKKRNSMLSMATQQRKADRIQAVIDELKPLQVSLPTLTEEEWLKACKHFKRCAICEKEDIEVRFMVLRPDEGGKYNRGNVLPTCTRCANRANRSRLQQHSFADSIARGSRYAKDNDMPERVRKAILYLIEEAQHD